MSRIRANVVTVILYAAGLHVASSAAAQSPALATYEDSDHGVSFSYPASWKREAMRPGLLGGETRPGPDEKGPFYGVNLVTPVGYFLSRVIPGSATCSKQVQRAIHEQLSAPRPVSIDGVPFHAVAFLVPLTGQSFEGTVYWAWRRGSCYLFESDVFTHPTPPDASPALMARRRRVEAEYKDVLRSVHLARE